MIQKLGKYSIVLKLGEGAMGSVYKAYDEVLDRHVAIKTMAEDIKWDPELKLRFYREARSAASLHHPNIVTIHDLGEEGKITYIVMELLEGKELKKIIQEKPPLSLEKKLAIIIQVADGLNHAHLHKIIHRDIKPGNIQVTPTGTVKILDFGIARIPSSDLTRSGVRLGTPIYMSPEQIRGGDYDERSDLFSAGIVVYELLTYVHPFRDKNIAKTLDNILFQTHLPFAELFPDAPPGLWTILANCLAKEPNKRFGSMAEFSRASRNLLEELTESAQQMTREVQAMLPRLRIAAERSGASYRLTQLRKEVEELLRRDEKPDFLTLKRLIADLSLEAAALQAAAPATQTKAPAPAGETHRAGPGFNPPVEPSTGFEPPVYGETSASAVIPPPPTPEQLRGRDLLRSGQALLNEGRIEEALEQLREAMRILGPEEEVVSALAQTRQKLDERKRARSAELLEYARQAKSAGSYNDAIHALDEILELEPNRAEAVELRRQALAEWEAERSRQAKKEQGEREKDGAQKLLGERKFRESLVSFRRAKEFLGDDSSILKGVAEAEEGIREEERRAKLEAEFAEVEKLLRSENFDEARERAQRALESAPDSGEAAALIEKVQRTRELKRLEHAEREKAAGFKLLSEKKFRESLVVLKHASRVLGDDAVIRVGIEEAEEGIRADELRAKVQAELNEAQKLLRSESFDEARARARRALELSPQNREGKDLLTQIDQAQAEKHKKDEIAALISRSKQALQREEFDEADLQAREVFLLDPQNAQANDILKRIEQARKEKIQKEKIAGLIAASQQALQKEDFHEAALRAKEIFQLDPRNVQADELLKSIDKAEAQKQRKDQLTLLLTRGQTALNEENFTEAGKQAREMLRLDPKNAEAAGLLKGIEQLLEKRKRAQISSLLSQGRQALGREEYAEALSKAGEAQALDQQNPDAAGLIKAVEEAQEKQKRDKIAALIFECQQALGRKNFDEAARRAQQVLDLDAKHKEAKSLLKQVEKDARAFEKEKEKERKRREKEANAAKAQEATQSTTDPLGKTVILQKPSISTAKVPRTALLIGAPILLVGLIIAAVVMMRKPPPARPPVDNAQQLGEARALFNQKNIAKAIEKLEAILKEHPGNKDAQNLLNEATEINRLVESLILEAQGYRKQERFEEALGAIGRILNVDPANQQALDIRAQVQAEQTSRLSQAEQDKEVATSLVKTGELIRAAKYEEAKSELDKIEKLRPDNPDLPKWRRRLKTAQDQASKPKEPQEEKKSVSAELGKHASEFFQQGKYQEAQSEIEKWQAEDRDNPQARELRAQVAEAMRARANYDSALRDKHWDQALEAAQQLEKVNPADPNVANLRAEIATRKASTKAFLSLVRLGEQAAVILDGQTLTTTAGELQEYGIPAGKHKLAVRSSQQFEIQPDFEDGRRYTYVYDIGKGVLREFKPEDKDFLARRREREVPQRWRVEHTHGAFFRGNCTGELVISGFQVEYRPDKDSEHAIRNQPFSLFHLNQENRDIELVRASDGRPIHKFKAADANQARAIRQFWDKMEKLAR